VREGVLDGGAHRPRAVKLVLNCHPLTKGLLRLGLVNLARVSHLAEVVLVSPGRLELLRPLPLLFLLLLPGQRRDFCLLLTARLDHVRKELEPVVLLSEGVFRVHDQALILVHNALSKVSLQKVGVVLRKTVFVEDDECTYGVAAPQDGVKGLVAAAYAVLSVGKGADPGLILIQYRRCRQLLSEASSLSLCS